MNIVDMSLQITLLIESLATHGAREAVALGVDGMDVTIQIRTSGDPSEYFVAQHTSSVGIRTWNALQLDSQI